MTTAIALFVSLAVLAWIVWVLVREVRQGRPQTPPPSDYRSYLDWRDNLLAWSRIGIH
jgi:hypothetical protein